METKKMTLKEAQEFVKNTKYIVWSEDESRQLQEKLFEIGCKWASGDKNLDNTEAPFLFVNHNLLITFAEKYGYEIFDDDSNQIKSADDVLNIQIIEEPKQKFNPKVLKPFDKVLVRDNNSSKWVCSLFSQFESDANFFYVCISCRWKMCIPYNEETKHLLGTSDEAPEFYRLD